jgi:hypothetical protein
MTYDEILPLVSGKSGILFASLSAITVPSKGFTRFHKNEIVLLPTSVESSYDSVVKARLLSFGKDPDDFVVGELAWGEPVWLTPENLEPVKTPLIKHKDAYYLQTIRVVRGEETLFMGSTEIPKDHLDRRDRSSNEGPAGVVVRTYLLDNIKALSVFL